MKTSKLVRVAWLGSDVWKELRLIAIRKNQTMSQIISGLILDYVNANCSKSEGKSPTNE